MMTKRSLAVKVNGEPCRTQAGSLADLVVERGLQDTRVATAVNGSFVPARERASRVLAAGDRIEILSARQGG